MHIIPSVDDGSQSIEESVTLLHMAVAQGVGTVIATPHIEKAQNLGLFSFVFVLFSLSFGANNSTCPAKCGVLGVFKEHIFLIVWSYSRCNDKDYQILFQYTIDGSAPLQDVQRGVARRDRHEKRV